MIRRLFSYLHYWLAYISIRVGFTYSPSLSATGQDHRDYYAIITSDGIAWKRKPPECRVGVTFTPEQIALIGQYVSAGDIVGAQAIILSEISHE